MSYFLPLRHEMVTVEAELHSAVATVQFAQFHLPEPSDALMSGDAHRLDLCLSPRPPKTRACYTNHWSRDRFERIGDLFVVPAGEALYCRSDEINRHPSIVCFLAPAQVRDWFEGDFEWTERRLENSLDIQNANIRALMFRLGEEARWPGFASATLTELVGAQIALELGRYCVDVPHVSPTGGLAPWRLRLIDERLAEVRAQPTLAELAQLCNLSVRQLTRSFRASRGCSIGDYIAHKRIEAAKRLLVSDENIKTIAYSMGFGSPSAFCYAFRRATGDTPREFRQRTRRGAQ